MSLVVALSLVSSPSLAQVSLRDLAEPAAPPRANSAPPSRRVAPGKTSERIAEGTEVRVRLEEQLSSATNAAGDTFSISTDEEIELADGVVIPAGFRGKGEVVEAHKKEMLGKAGELAIRLDYVRIGSIRVHLRANKAGQGRSGLTTALVLSFIVTPLFLMHHGADLVFPRGQAITAYVDEDVDIPLPIPSSPRLD
jgi:hypothetical protein